MVDGRFLPRVKRSTAELIESFKVIGIDNAQRVNKSYECVRWVANGFAGIEVESRRRGEDERTKVRVRRRILRSGDAGENLVASNPVIFSFKYRPRRRCTNASVGTEIDGGGRRTKRRLNRRSTLISRRAVQSA